MSENKKAVPGRDGKRATTDSTLNIAQNNITIFKVLTNINFICISF